MAYYVDTGIQYRGYNTFRMEAPAKVKSWIFGVEGLETISHSFYAYATTALTGTIRTKTRWISGNGITLSVEDHTWAIPEAGLFNWIKLEGIPVPAGAVYAQLELHNTSGKTYWVGLIKSEAGDKATDFTHNLSGQLTRITASGIYTGTITAQQVILSSTTGENLPERLTTINSNMVQLTNKTSKNESDITTIKAGQITLQSNISSVDGKLNTANSKITQIEAGNITLSSSTSGRIAGMSLTSDRLEFSSSGAYMRLMGRSGWNPIMIGTSANNINFSVNPSGYLSASGVTLTGSITATSGKIGGLTISSTTLKATSAGRGVLFSGSSSTVPIWVGDDTYTKPVFWVDWNGKMTANNAEIKGTLKAGSVINGTLNSTTGTHTGTVNGTLSNTTGTHAGYVSGSLSNTSGRHNGTHYGYHEGQGYTYSNSTLGGSLSGTLGSHNGTINSSTGMLGGVRYSSVGSTTLYIGGGMQLNGSLRVPGTVYYKTLSQISDEKLKDNIKEVEPDKYITSFYSLELKNFNFRNDDDKKLRLGIIAQDFIKDNDNELIDLVVGANDGYLNVKYENLYLMNILATQELNARVKKLEEKLNA